MIDIQDLPYVESQLREAAKDFRRIGMEVEADNSAIDKYLDLPGVQWLSFMFIPEEYNPAPFKGKTGKNYYFMTCAERVVSLEALAYGDCGVLLACPGPSMSGHIVYDLGSPEQKERYYGHVSSKPTWTFFALTEPARGSDATMITTELRPGEDGLRIFGEKRFVGNASRADIGVVFARRHPGPLGIEVVLVDRKRSPYQSEVLPTLGMRGAGISRLVFEGCPVNEDDIVGGHLNPSKRGLWGAIQTFNRMRPGLCAMAVGVAQAAYDYIIENRRDLNENEKARLQKFESRLSSVRAIVRKAARVADEDCSNGALASVAKIRAVDLVEDLTDESFRFFGPKAAWDHPWLSKWYRDARAFEYMEGTSMVHKIQLHQAFLKGKLADV